MSICQTFLDYYMTTDIALTEKYVNNILLLLYQQFRQALDGMCTFLRQFNDSKYIHMTFQCYLSFQLIHSAHTMSMYISSTSCNHK